MLLVKLNSKLNLVRIKIAFRIIIPIALLILPGNYFDNGNSLCVSKVFFHIECPACGLARACMHLIHFQFEDAYAYNMFSFISFPILAFFWGYLFVKEVKLLRKYS